MRRRPHRRRRGHLPCAIAFASDSRSPQYSRFSRSQDHKRRTPSCSHHVLCLRESETKKSRLHVDRRDARAEMRKEMERINRLSTSLLQEQAEDGARGVVVVAEEGALLFEKETLDALVPAAVVTPPAPAVRHFALFAKASAGSSSTTMVTSQPTINTIEPTTESAAVHAESAAVLAAIAQHVDMQNLQYDRLLSMLDGMRAGSTTSPHMAVWMKELVYALPPPGDYIERPLGTLADATTICPISGRVFRPWPLQHLLMQMVHLHVDLVGNPILKSLMLVHGIDGPLCLQCLGPTKYAALPCP